MSDGFDKVMEFVKKINLAEYKVYIKHQNMTDVMFRPLKVTLEGDHVKVLGEWINIADKNHPFGMNLIENIRIKKSDIAFWDFIDFDKVELKDLF